MITTGDRVVYGRDPILFGVLVVTWMRTDGRVECVPAVEFERSRAREQESGQAEKLRGEVFGRSELVLVKDFVRSAA